MTPQAVRCVEQDPETLLAFYACPPELWRTLRTTNPIERAFRRRTRPMSCLQNNASCERIIYAVFRRLTKRGDRALPLALKPHKLRCPIGAGAGKPGPIRRTSALSRDHVCDF